LHIVSLDAATVTGTLNVEEIHAEFARELADGWCGERPAETAEYCSLALRGDAMWLTIAAWWRRRFRWGLCFGGLGRGKLGRYRFRRLSSYWFLWFG
jgi:hypothetical protein